jgi:DNA-binding GntR family transcriptional regulator
MGGDGLARAGMVGPVEVDRGSRTVPWRQVYAVLRADIMAGRYGPDDRLPSLNELSAQYGINRKTANKALMALADEGLIEVENGVGYYVRQR